MAEYLISGFCVGSACVALLARSRRRSFMKTTELNRVIPMNQEVNKLYITRDNGDSFTVWTCEKKRLYKIQREKSSWYIQNSRKENTAIVKNKFTEKWIALNNTSMMSLYQRESPLGTTPSIIKLDYNLWDFLGFTRENIDYCFGTNVVLRWVGKHYFEIITRNESTRDDKDMKIHKRVAYCFDFDTTNQTYLMLFNYDEINIEVLLGTFLCTYLLQVRRSPGQRLYDFWYRKEKMSLREPEALRQEDVQIVNHEPV